MTVTSLMPVMTSLMMTLYDDRCHRDVISVQDLQPSEALECLVLFQPREVFVLPSRVELRLSPMTEHSSVAQTVGYLQNPEEFSVMTL